MCNLFWLHPIYSIQLVAIYLTSNHANTKLAYDKLRWLYGVPCLRVPPFIIIYCFKSILASDLWSLWCISPIGWCLKIQLFDVCKRGEKRTVLNKRKYSRKKKDFSMNDRIRSYLIVWNVFLHFSLGGGRSYITLFLGLILRFEHHNSSESVIVS